MAHQTFNLNFHTLEDFEIGIADYPEEVRMIAWRFSPDKLLFYAGIDNRTRIRVTDYMTGESSATSGGAGSSNNPGSFTIVPFDSHTFPDFPGVNEMTVGAEEIEEEVPGIDSGRFEQHDGAEPVATFALRNGSNMLNGDMRSNEGVSKDGRKIH